jgi:hypothetical protein
MLADAIKFFYKVNEENIMAFLSRSAAGKPLSAEEQEQLEIWYDGFTEYHELTFSLREDRNDICNEIKERIFNGIGIPVPVHESMPEQRFVMPELLKRILTALCILVVGIGIWLWIATKQEQKDRHQYNSVSTQSQHTDWAQAVKPVH